jgi:hypothetical protein
MSNDKDPAPFGLTGEEQATIMACTRLVDDLGHGRVPLASMSDLQRALTELEPVVFEHYRQQLATDITAASGAAVEHDWQVINHTIQCSRCPLDSAGSVLRRGAVPPCDPANTCPKRRQTGGRHLLLPAIDGHGSDCCFCRTTYAGTPTLVSNPASRNAPKP